MLAECGEIVTLKKKHPCGSARFEVVRTGADYKLRCCGCGSMVILDHDTLKKRLRGKEERSIGEKERS